MKTGEVQIHGGGTEPYLEVDGWTPGYTTRLKTRSSGTTRLLTP